MTGHRGARANRSVALVTDDFRLYHRLVPVLESQGLRVLGLRPGEPAFVPRERFAFLKERLGDGFVAVELRQEDGHPDGELPKSHSVLTGDLIDEPGEPTRAALDQVLDLFRRRLVTA